ncbi:MAG TPA: hypothetical protein V6C72_10495 [Chroococcales cyanobacterium]
MDKDFERLYRACRLEDQRAFYHARASEFQQAQRQALIISNGLVALVLVANGLENFGLFWLSFVGSILAVILPQCVQMLAGYNAFYAFAPQAQLYADAADQLDQLSLGGEQDDLYAATEAVLEREQGQWPEKVQYIRKKEAAG